MYPDGAADVLNGIKIKEDVGKKKFEKIKKTFLEYDEDYLEALEELDGTSKKELKKNKRIIRDLIYQKDYAKAWQRLTLMHNETIKKHKK